RLGVCHGAIEQSEAERLCRRVVQSLVDKPLDAVARGARVEVTLIEQLERHLAGAGARVHDSGGWVVRWFGRSPARSSDRSCMHFGAQVHPTTEPGWRPAPIGLAPVERGLCTRKRLPSVLPPSGLPRWSGVCAQESACRGPTPPPGSPRWSGGLNTR